MFLISVDGTNQISRGHAGKPFMNECSGYEWKSSHWFLNSPASSITPSASRLSESHRQTRLHRKQPVFLRSSARTVRHTFILLCHFRPRGIMSRMIHQCYVISTQLSIISLSVLLLHESFDIVYHFYFYCYKAIFIFLIRANISLIFIYIFINEYVNIKICDSRVFKIKHFEFKWNLIEKSTKWNKKSTKWQ